MNVSGKITLITGADGEIGRGICGVLASRGARVIRAGRKVDGDVSSGSVKLDITSKKSINEAVRSVLGVHRRIDILVNNAGVVAAPGWDDRQKESDEDWKVNYEVNLRGTAWMIDAVSEHMKKHGGGKIVNISSGAGRVGLGDYLPMAYGATKAGVINLTQSYALSLAKFNINVNAICPGLIWTPMWEKVGRHLSISRESEHGLTAKEVFDRQVKARVPLGRPQTPEDVGYAVLFFVSDEARNITGQTLNVNGGVRMD